MTSLNGIPKQRSHVVDREQFDVFTAQASNAPQQPGDDPLRSHLHHSKIRDRDLVAPRGVVRRVQDALRRRTKGRSDTSHAPPRGPAPLLAPRPPQKNARDRLGPELKDRPRIPPVKEFLQSPVQASKEVIQHIGGDDFAQNVAKSEVSHGANVALALEHARVQEAMGDDGTSCDEDVLDALKQSRQDSFTRWTMDRHVRNIGRIQANIIPLRSRKDFLRRDVQGVERTNWSDYGQHLWHYVSENYTRPRVEAGPEFPEPSQELLASSLERMILASSSLQGLLLSLRKLSRWEDPLATGMLMVVYFSLVFARCIPQATVIIIFFKVVLRRFSPPTIEEMHRRLARSEDKDLDAEDLTELIVKHGTHGWVDRLIETAGPVLLCCAENLADFMETMNNFYEWRNPRETYLGLFRLMVLLVVVALVPTWLLAQSVFTILGLVFFVANPVSIFAPRYRLLASPSSWLFWRTPTHADWAIARLQEEARQQLQIIRQQTAEQERRNASSCHEGNLPQVNENHASHDTTGNIGSYKCKGVGRGKLLVTTASVAFVPSEPKNQKWTVDYTELKGIHKVPSSHLPGQSEGLGFVQLDGKEHKVGNLRSRDEVFSQIIGYSNVQWKKTG